jgi:hypothetical protein
MHPARHRPGPATAGLCVPAGGQDAADLFAASVIERPYQARTGRQLTA